MYRLLLSLTEYIHIICTNTSEDQIFIAQDYEDNTYLANVWKKLYTKWRLEVKFNKTHTYVCVGEHCQNLALDNGQLHQ